jgi:cyclophilin family peptidyl-prolyl cis-trans isomerase
MLTRPPATLALCALALLTACGGGNSGPSVSAISAGTLGYGQTGVFSLTGELLDQGLSVSAEGCTQLMQAPGGTSSGQSWSCTVDAVGTGAVKLQVKTASGSVLKEQSFDVPVPTSAVVASIRGSGLMYSKSAVFTFAGMALDKDFTVTAKGCKGLAQVAGGSATAQSVSCKVNAVGTGAVLMEAKSANGTVLRAQSFDVLPPQVTLSTNLGTMVVELNPTAAPVTVDNFLQYVADKFYDNTIFHRIYAVGISIVQGGWLSPTPDVQPGQRAPIALEVGKGLSNVRGSVAMARTSALDSATSQFYFNVTDNVALDTANGGYAVFGKLVSGLETMDAIAKVPTTTQFGLADFPTSNVLVQNAVQTQ